MVADPVQALGCHPGEGALVVERAARDLAGPMLVAEAVDMAEAALALPAALDEVGRGRSTLAGGHEGFSKGGSRQTSADRVDEVGTVIQHLC